MTRLVVISNTDHCISSVGAAVERMKHFLLLSYLMSVLSGKVVTKKGRIKKLGWKKNIIYFISSNFYWYLQNLPADCSCGEERRGVCKVSSDPGGMDYIWNGRVTKVDTNYICKPTQRVSSNLWGKSVPLDGQVEGHKGVEE